MAGPAFPLGAACPFLSPNPVMSSRFFELPTQSATGTGSAEFLGVRCDKPSRIFHFSIGESMVESGTGCTSARTTRARPTRARCFACRGSNALGEGNGMAGPASPNVLGEGNGMVGPASPNALGEGNGMVGGPASPFHPPDPGDSRNPPGMNCDKPAKATPPRGGATRLEESGDPLLGGSGNCPEVRTGDCPRARPAGRLRTRTGSLMETPSGREVPSDCPSLSSEDSTNGRACKIVGRFAGGGILGRGCDNRAVSSLLLTREGDRGDRGDLGLSPVVCALERAASCDRTSRSLTKDEVQLMQSWTRRPHTNRRLPSQN
jgi:hypothetical protein